MLAVESIGIDAAVVLDINTDLLPPLRLRRGRGKLVDSLLDTGEIVDVAPMVFPLTDGPFRQRFGEEGASQRSCKLAHRMAPTSPDTSDIIS